MKTNLRGVGVALVTPFDENRRIDFDALGNLIEYVIAGGCDYLVALGTTAENPTLSAAERVETVRFIRQKNNARLPLVVGVGGNSTSEVVAQLERFDYDGVDAILSVTPYYNKPSQQGIYEHFRAVAAASGRPVILYNVPGRTGVNMTAETTLRIVRDSKNIIGIKEAGGSLSQMACILRDRPEGFLVISGDDDLTFPLIAMGGDGVISVAANAFPKLSSAMVHYAFEDRIAEAARLHLRLTEANAALFAEGSPAGIKAALHSKGMVSNVLRLPLIPCTETLYRRLVELIGRFELE